MKTAVLLELSNVIKDFETPGGGRRRILDVPVFELEKGGQAALEGDSGSGKTTFLHVIAGLLTPDGGRVLLDGEDMASLPEPARDRLRARRVGYVFQAFNLLQGLTALENVLLAQSFGRGVDEVFARALLAEVGLKGHLDHRPRQLSAGQQQRVALARALSNRPALVLADEPTASLDPDRAASSLALLKKLCEENGAALLLASHDREALARFPRRMKLSDINRAERPSFVGGKP